MNRRSAIRSLLSTSLGVTLTPLAPLASLGSARAEAAIDGGVATNPPTPAAPQVAEPFRIDFGVEAFADLLSRIDRMRWPEMPFQAGWSEGTPQDVLRELVEYWREDYDWFEIQARLNRLDHRRLEIEGEALHFVRYPPNAAGGVSGSRPDGADGGGGDGDPARAFPLLLLHGWPGSFHEFSRAAPLLASGGDGSPAFEVIVPSLPGFVFSDPPREPGMNPGRIAERLHLLMVGLGHERYGIQGGDWGAIIGTQMARRRPDAVAGLHLNFVASAPPPPEGVEPSEEELAYREARSRFQGDETGYSSIQGTRPRSLAYAQQDSPVGWLAWMLEKYWAWSDHGGELWDTFDRDDILTTAMLYWLPGRILSAARIYYETSNAAPGSFVGGRVDVPTGYARFPAEPWGPPREVVERSYDLVHYSEPPRGGHFPALEQPDVWAADVAEFFRGVV